MQTPTYDELPEIMAAFMPTLVVSDGAPRTHTWTANVDLIQQHNAMQIAADTYWRELSRWSRGSLVRAGGKPKPGTPPDKRLKRNKPGRKGKRG